MRKSGKSEASAFKSTSHLPTDATNSRFKSVPWHMNEGTEEEESNLKLLVNKEIKKTQHTAT